MKPGDLVMPKDNFLRMIHPYPSNIQPGVLVERILTHRSRLPGSNNGWQVLWRNEKHVMFENEFEVINA
jgi:hypothetical protein